MLTFLLKVSQLTGDEGVKQKLGASNNLHKFDMEKSDTKGDIVIFAQIDQETRISKIDFTHYNFVIREQSAKRRQAF